MTADADDPLSIAHHEAGHIVAGLISGAEWTRTELDPPDHPDLRGATWFRSTGAYEDPAVRAFIHWSGAFAESKFRGTSLRASINSRSCGLDRQHFEMYRLFHPTLDNEWAERLDPHWSTIERTAVLLATKQTIVPTDTLASAEDVERVLRR